MMSNMLQDLKSNHSFIPLLMKLVNLDVLLYLYFYSLFGAVCHLPHTL